MGPGLTETARTPHLLAELGLEYVLDWTNDDQPQPEAWLTTSDEIAAHYWRATGSTPHPLR